MLQGKTKEEVLKYYDSSTIKYLLGNINFDDLPLIVQQSICIGFFDSVGIYVLPNLDCDGFNYEINSFNIINPCGDGFDTRTEATTQALTKALEIFNQLNKQL